MECALNLYDLVLDDDSIAYPKGHMRFARLRVECTRDQIESP